MPNWSDESHTLRLMWILFLICCNAAHAATPMVSLGSNFSVALRSDGKVMTWGADDYGQLGTGRLPFSPRPSLVTQLDSVKSLGAGVAHSLAVRKDGTVWAWGRNSEGQLGGGSGADRASAAQVQGVANVTTTCGGDYFSLALQADATVLAWGASYDGVLGNGGYETVATPVRVAGLSNVTAIACGFNHALALHQDGTVWAWGANGEGELGDGSTTSRSKPVRVQGISDVVSIAAGEYFSAALKSDGTVWEWGVREGYATLHGKPRILPERSAGISGATSIAASLNSFWLIAVHSDKQNWWNWETGTAPAMKEPAGAIQAVAYAYGQFLFLKPDGTVLAGGGGGYGSLGDGTTNYRDEPGAVADISRIVQVAAGGFHGLALDSDGKVWSWGLDVSGQLGSGRILGRSTPGEVAGLSNVVQLDAGSFHSHAVDRDGNVWAWGDNGYGQFGDGTYLSSSTPVRLSTISGVQSVAAGAWYSMALQRDGTLWQWGSMVSNQFDAPALPNRLLENVSAIAAGPVHALALKSDGTVWSWGANNERQLGDGTTTEQLRPRIVPGLTGVKLIAASGSSNYAVLTDGTVLAWGGNGLGQLGNGSGAEGIVPVAVSGLTDVIEIAAGLQHVLARKRDGTVWGWSWGGNAGELGNGTDFSVSKAAHVAELSAIQHIAAGYFVSAFVREDGQVLMGGKNSIGQLGDGTFAVRPYLGLAVNSTVNGFLSLGSGVASKVAPSLGVAFFVTALGGITETRASVSSAIRFNPSDNGKLGSVFVTALVPSGSLGATPIGDKSSKHVIAAQPRQLAATSTCPAPASSLTLVQLTPTGWQTVVNGQLLPYASGVLGDQLAAQTILSGVDTTYLKGAEFCVGYGTSAQTMIDNGNIRAVATIPGGATTTSTCVVGGTISMGLSVAPGWNLLGNPINQSISVADKFGDANKVSSVWRWDAVKANWQFYSPSFGAVDLLNYATAQGFGVLREITAGDGYWVHAKTQADMGTQCGQAINLRQSSLSSGWNLVSTASTVSAEDFNLSLGTTTPTVGQVPVNLTSLWAWDANQSNWYFYAPSLEAQRGSALSDYIKSKGYEDFTNSGKTLGNGVGIWVNRP